jgi:transcriptional regulator with GAF, ATPase, and Fis domain
MAGGDVATLTIRGHTRYVARFELVVLDGPDRGLRVASRSDELSIGSADGNDLVLTDPAVSRHHCALRSDERGLSITDLGSRNGTFVDGVEVVTGFLHDGSRVRIGGSLVHVRALDDDVEQPLASTDRLGALLGGSSAMRRLYALIEQYAASTATVLIVGETGTGKELIAEQIHAHSSRRHAPFVVVDCSALSHELAESELFGHERGAFTGADVQRIGAFESADGGTIFLDEIGELPISLQPLLLRVLEARTIRRVGCNEQRAVDVRVVAASHRDLRVLVNDKHFRADLFYRLNVLRIAVPPLRERGSDIELLARELWRTFRPDSELPPGLLGELAAQSWPGNVRELRNTVERAALIGWQPERAVPCVAGDTLTYQEAKERAAWDWERGWVQRLLAAHGGNLSRAARATKIGRSHLRELARRYGVVTRGGTIDMTPPPPDDD